MTYHSTQRNTLHRRVVRARAVRTRSPRSARTGSTVRSLPSLSLDGASRARHFTRCRTRSWRARVLRRRRARLPHARRWPPPQLLYPSRQSPSAMAFSIERNVGGVSGLHLALNVFSEAEEQRLFAIHGADTRECVARTRAARACAR
jgi:hypothetical protein